MKQPRSSSQVENDSTRPMSLQACLRARPSDTANGWQRIIEPLNWEASDLQERIQSLSVTLESLARSAWVATVHRYTGAPTVAAGVEFTNQRPASPAHPDTTIGLQLACQNDLTSSQLCQLIERETARQREQRPGAGEKTLPAIDLLMTQSLTRHHPDWPTNWLIGSLKTDGQTSLELHFHGDIYDEPTARQFLRNACAALSDMLEQPDMPLGKLRLVDPAPMRALNEHGSLEKWAYQGPTDIPGALARQAEQSPEAIALRFSLPGHQTSHWTYTELISAANRWATELTRLGVGAGDVVALAVGRGPATIAAMLGILKTGAAYLPIDTSFPAERIRFMLAHARASLAICQQQHQSLFSEEIETLTLNDDTIDGLAPLVSRLTGTQEQPTHLAIRPVDTAYIMYTSGSTGKPKGVCVSHQAILRLVSNARFMQLDSTVSMLHAAPLGFDASTLEIWGPLLNGGTCVLYTEPLPTGFDLATTINRHGANAAWITAALFNTIIDDDPQHLAGLKQILTGGEALSVAHMRRAMLALPDATFINGYGPTESTTFTTTHTITALADDATQVPIGRPISATWLAIANETLQPVPAGVVGELLTGGVGLTQGYLNSADQTRRSFIENPFGEGPPLLYRTGDLVRLDRDGHLQFVGRADDQVKIRGYRVEPREIEAVISQAAGVSQCAVVTETDPATGIRFVAYVVAQENTSLDTAALQKTLAAQLPGYMQPADYIALDALPLTANGKLDRRQLPTAAQTPTTAPAAAVVTEPAPATADSSRPGEPAAARSSTSGQQTPQTRQSVQETIQKVFAQVLNTGQFASTDHFFDQGGNSLLAIAAINALRSQHDIVCPVGDFYSFPTARGLAAALVPDDASHPPVTQTGPGTATPDTDRDDDAIAIIGMTARLPGAESIEQFWNNLIGAVDSIHQFSRDELDPSLPEALRHDPAYVPARGILTGADQFDAAFFGISPREAELLDPQQRIFLQLCWSCLEDAGYIPDETSRPDAPVGVFAGMYNASYRQNNLAAHPDKIAQLGEFLVMLGNEKDYIATRTAHRLNLTGPAISVHTACSTSLVAIIQACDSLLAGQCESALAGGVSITCPPASGHLFLEGAMMSPDGLTRPFDAQAAGTVFSDGAGVVLLKKLSHAQRDGDQIHAVIRGGAINNDGGGKASFMAPSAAGQAQVIRQALKRARVSPRSISYVEAHGTATPSGDPIETDGLKQVYAPRETVAQPWCALGSVKSNIGHTVTAAGVAGLIKTVLALKHELIPATLHFEQLNPAIDLDGSPFRIASEAIPWPHQDGQPRRAGISAFGVGGTNAHLIIEEAPPSAPPIQSAADTETPSVLRVSANSEAALKRAVRQLGQALTAADAATVSLGDVAHTLHVARKPMRWRAAVCATSLEQAAAQLNQPIRATDASPAGQTRPLVFVFPGQGSQYVRMGSGLMQTSPVFDQAYRAAIAQVDPHLSRPGILKTLLLDSDDADALAQTEFLQPALYCLELALARTLMAAGFEPDAMIGHSIGEFAAAVLAGIMSDTDAARLVARRGALMQDQPAGAMLSVRLSANELRKMLPAGVDLAANNGPASAVCAGTTEAIDAFAKQLEQQEIPCRVLQTSHAFHSAMMQPAADAFRQACAGVSLAAPGLTVISTCTGETLGAEQAVSADYWADQLRSAVQFAPAIMQAQTQFSNPVFLELGPRASLSALIKTLRGADKSTPTAFAAFADSPDQEACGFAAMLGQLWCTGFDCRGALPTSGRRISLPTYPFEPTRHWLDAAPAGSQTVAVVAATSNTPDPVSAEAEPAVSATPVNDQLRGLLEQASGLEFTADDDEVSFAELGLDSLSLTQIAMQVQRAFRTEVSFRQLMQETDSIARLADYLTEHSPPAAAQQPATTAASPVKSAQASSAPAKPAKSKAFGAIARIQTNKTELTEDQRNRVSKLIEQYSQRTARSKAYAQEHRDQMADPRVVNGFKPILKEITYPIVTQRSAGAYFWDLDGHQYIDALNGFGMNLFGWQPQFVTDAVRQAIDNGYEIGPQHPLAGAVAAGVCELTGADRAALCNTGSEAVMGATRMARTVTGRPKVVVFDGAYHGIFDEVIVRGARNHRAIPAAPGIMPNTSENVISLPYGTPESLQVIRDNADDIAAVLVEPVQSRRPDFQPVEFLRELRQLTSDTGVVLVFDEVVTGFRTHPAGIQAVFDIKADITTYGKVVGGGFPIGIIAGKRQYMDSLDGGTWQFGDDSVPTVGVTYFAGTFVRHPLALAAADAVLKHLKAAGPELQENLNRRTTAFARELNEFTERVGAPVEIRHFSSFWKITFTADHLMQELLFPMMRQRGIHILDGFPSFMTTAHTDEDINAIKEAYIACVTELQRGRFLPGRGSKPGVLFDARRPPVPGARLGRDHNGKPAWFVPNPNAPGKYLRIEDNA